MLSGCSRSRGYVLDLEARQVSRFRRDGRMAGRGPSFTCNLLLDALLDEERERLLEDATTHPIELGHVYLDPGDRIRKVMFPISGTLSIIAEPDERHRVEA